MGIAGLLSTISTIGLFSFLTYRMIYWRKYYAQPLATNQVFVLIYNLLLADFQQALSFLISFHWISENKLVGPSTVCFAQGWLIQIGDVSSGMWVLAIAVHTFISLVGQKAVPDKAFIAAVVSLWMFVLLLTAIGPILNEADFFVPAGAWVCQPLTSHLTPCSRCQNKRNETQTDSHKSAGLTNLTNMNVSTFTTCGSSRPNSVLS